MVCPRLPCKTSSRGVPLRTSDLLFAALRDKECNVLAIMALLENKLLGKNNAIYLTLIDFFLCRMMPIVSGFKMMEKI